MSEVIDKEHSPTSVKLYIGCPRRWAFERLFGFKSEETNQKTFGKEVHAEIEAWIRHGTMPKMPATLAWLAMFAKHPYFPSKGTSQAEEHFHMNIAGVRWHGFTDWRRQKVLGSRQHIVGDAKTTNDLKYALKAGAGGLLYDSDGVIDPQSTIYATREFVEGAFTVDLHWGYVQSKAPYTTRLVETQVERSACEDAYGVFHGHALEMNQLYQIRPKANDIPYRPGYCRAFNKPCEQTDRCERARGVFSSSPLDLDSQKDLSMKNFLDSIRDSVPTEDDAPPPPPVDEDEAPPAPPEEDDAPPPPPDEEEIEAEKLVNEYMASERAKRAAPTEVEAGFINAPEARGKAPYATPEEAAVGEGVAQNITVTAGAMTATVEPTTDPFGERSIGEYTVTFPEKLPEGVDIAIEVKPKKTRAKRTAKTDRAEAEQTAVDAMFTDCVAVKASDAEVYAAVAEAPFEKGAQEAAKTATVERVHTQTQVVDGGFERLTRYYCNGLLIREIKEVQTSTEHGTDVDTSTTHFSV